MKPLDFLLAIIGAGGFTAIINSLVSSRTTLKAAAITQTAVENAQDIEKAKVEFEELRAALTDARQEVKDLKLERAEDRTAMKHTVDLLEKEHLELVALRIWKAKHDAEEAGR